MNKKEILDMIKNEFQRYQISTDYDQHQKNVRYSELMSLMERVFNIDILEADGIVTRGNSEEVVKLYKALSDARDFSSYPGQILIEDEDNWDIYRTAKGEYLAVQRKNTNKFMQENDEALTASLYKENISEDAAMKLLQEDMYENEKTTKAMTVRLEEKRHIEIMKHCIDLNMSFNQYVKTLLGIEERLRNEIERIADLPSVKDNEDMLEVLQMISCWLTEEMVPIDE